MISIVIPAYNAQRFLAETIESVLAQTRQDWEMIIVDDGSTDDTLAVARSFADREPRICVLHQENAGVCHARNRGYAHTDPANPYVAFLDADDRYLPEALHLLATALDTHPEAIGAHGLASLIDEKSQRIAPGYLENKCRPRPKLVGKRVVPSATSEPTTFANLIVSGCIAAPSVVLMRRTALSSVGLFDPDVLGHSADWDIYIRLARQGDFVYLDQVVLEYRKYGANMSDNSSKMRESRIRVLKKAYAAPENSLEQQHIVRYSFRATQKYEANQKIRYVAENLSHGDMKGAAAQTRYLAGCVLKYLRGSP